MIRSFRHISFATSNSANACQSTKKCSANLLPPPHTPCLFCRKATARTAKEISLDEERRLIEAVCEDTRHPFISKRSIQPRLNRLMRQRRWHVMISAYTQENHYFPQNIYTVLRLQQ